MENVLNFRDAMGGKSGRLGPLARGRVFRSAALEGASKHDIERILHDLRVRSIIDLRRPGESKKVAKDGAAGLHGVAIAGDFAEVDRAAPLAAAAPAAAANQRRLHRIDIVRSAESVVLQSVSWFWKIVVGVLRLFGFKRLSNSVGIKRSILGREGLVGLNKVLLEGAQKDIRRIMDICADESSYPVIVHCSAGKDRTGLTIALLQLLAGVPDDVVVADYAISETLLSQRMGNLLVDVGRMGLGDQFAKSPPEVMVATIELIKTKYGGINAYLESIGVSKDQQRRICELLADKTGSNSTLTSSRL